LAEEIGGTQEAIYDGAQKEEPKTTTTIDKILHKGQEIMVQVVKESIGTKGPRLTTKIALPGRYLVLTPMQHHFGVSKRIDDANERNRLRNILKELKVPKEMGLIVRTAGLGRTKRDFIRDLKFLLNLWKKIKIRSKRTKEIPTLLYQEHDLIFRVIRDSFTGDIKRIIVDSKDVYKKTAHFLRSLMPGAKVKLEFYKGQLPLFEKKGIERQIEQIYERKAYLKGGGYLVIEPTEGLVSIDVNTGRQVGSKNVEDTVFAVNLEAAKQLPRHIRLRDLGGIIVIDFIDMKSTEHKKKVFKALEEALKPDRAKTNILRISELGLVEMTRQRTGGPLESLAYRECPYCQGRGSVKSTTTVAIITLRKLKQFLKEKKSKRVELIAHPDIVARLLTEDRRSVSDIERRFRTKISVKPDKFIHLENIKIQGV